MPSQHCGQLLQGNSGVSFAYLHTNRTRLRPVKHCVAMIPARWDKENRYCLQTLPHSGTLLGYTRDYSRREPFSFLQSSTEGRKNNPTRSSYCVDWFPRIGRLMAHNLRVADNSDIGLICAHGHERGACWLAAMTPGYVSYWFQSC